MLGQQHTSLELVEIELQLGVHTIGLLVHRQVELFGLVEPEQVEHKSPAVPVSPVRAESLEVEETLLHRSRRRVELKHR